MTVTIVAPACCPLLGSDHFLCVGTTSFPRLEVPDVPRGIPLLRNWRPTLLRAFSQLSLWAQKILLQSSIEQPLREVDQTSILDGLCSTTTQSSAPPTSLVGCRLSVQDGISGLSGKITSPLSAHNPRVAPSIIRRTFQAERVQWRDHPDPPSGHDSVALWREHFSSVGAHSEGSFDETFFQDVMGQFSQLKSSHKVGPFDGPFSAS